MRLKWPSRVHHGRPQLRSLLWHLKRVLFRKGGTCRSKLNRKYSTNGVLSCVTKTRWKRLINRTNLPSKDTFSKHSSRTWTISVPSTKKRFKSGWTANDQRKKKWLTFKLSRTNSETKMTRGNVNRSATLSARKPRNLLKKKSVSSSKPKRGKKKTAIWLANSSLMNSDMMLSVSKLIKIWGSLRKGPTPALSNSKDSTKSISKWKCWKKTKFSPTKPFRNTPKMTKAEPNTS